MEDANSPNMTELKAIVARLSRRIEEISILDNNIVKALEKEEDIMEETDQTQDIIHYGVLKINEFIAKNNRRWVRSIILTSNTKPDAKIHVNLPKLHIQSFNGNPLEWLTFWDSFNNAIQENDSLNNIDKMNRLKGMLTDDATRAIAGLPITSQNYEKYIELLKERFGRKQILITAHIWNHFQKLTTHQPTPNN